MNAGAYILVAIGIFAAKCLGFVRDIVFAGEFGATEYTDIYFQIFGLASLVFTGIGGALSTLVIKNLNKPGHLGIENQKKYVSHFITRTAIMAMVATGIMYLCARPIVRVLLPGLSSDMFEEAVKIMYIMLPSCVFVIVAYIISGVLQNSKVFFITSIMSLPYNVIVMAVLLPGGTCSITTVSAVTTIGWFLHIAILLPSFYRKGFRILGNPALPTGTGERNTEVIYIFISSMMFQLVFMADKAAVSSTEGAASMVNYASNLFVTVSSVFVIAMSNVSYPSLCRHYEQGNTEFVKKSLQYIITVLLAIIAPFILTVSCFGEDIISLLYERGEFTAEMSRTTASLFAIYTVGVFGYVCQELLNKVLYLASGYVYTVAGTLSIVILKPLINLAIADSGDPRIIAVSTTVLFCIYAAVVLVALKKVIGSYVSRDFIINIFKIAIGAGAAYGVYILLDGIHFMTEQSFGFVVNLAICAAVYLAVIIASGCGKYMIKKHDFTA